MKRFGASKKTMQPMNENNGFMVRLHLLTIIVKAALKGYPVGTFRQQAAIENANEIHRQIDHMKVSFLKGSTSSHLFKQRVKLLCIMATAMVSENYPMGGYRRQAISDNLEVIVKYAFPDKQEQLFDDILKVA
ncbi:MAG: hypothetical protein ABIJ31_05695 [Pseudomonadota bacterium]